VDIFRWILLVVLTVVTVFRVLIPTVAVISISVLSCRHFVRNPPVSHIFAQHPPEIPISFPFNNMTDSFARDHLFDARAHDAYAPVCVELTPLWRTEWSIHPSWDGPFATHACKLGTAHYAFARGREPYALDDLVSPRRCANRACDDFSRDLSCDPALQSHMPQDFGPFSHNDDGSDCSGDGAQHDQCGRDGGPNDWRSHDDFPGIGAPADCGWPSIGRFAPAHAMEYCHDECGPLHEYTMPHEHTMGMFAHSYSPPPMMHGVRSPMIPRARDPSTPKLYASVAPRFQSSSLLKKFLSGLGHDVKDVFVHARGCERPHCCLNSHGRLCTIFTKDVFITMADDAAADRLLAQLLEMRAMSPPPRRFPFTFQLSFEDQYALYRRGNVEGTQVRGAAA